MGEDRDFFVSLQVTCRTEEADRIRIATESRTGRTEQRRQLGNSEDDWEGGTKGTWMQQKRTQKQQAG